MALGRLDHFEVLRLLGRGGMSDVYLARDTHLDCDVALKVLRTDRMQEAAQRAWLLREAHALAKLDHPNVVGVLDCGEAAPDPPRFLWPDRDGPFPERVLYVAMRYVEGHDLAEEIGAQPLPLRIVVPYAAQIARGLEAAHAQGITHRDLKPGNIRVTPEGVLKIVDFGLASTRRAVRADDPTESAHSTNLLGTLHYMSPEQAGEGGTVDARSDLFSLGVIVYEMVTGQRPFRGDTVAGVLRAITTAAPPPLARFARDVPEELERIVGKLLHKEPSRRYQSAHDAATDLDALAARLGAPAGRGAAWPAARRTWSRVRLALLVLGAAVLLVAAPPVLRRLVPSTDAVAIPDFENLTGDVSLDRLAVGLGMDLVTSLATGSRTNVVRPTLRDGAGRPVRDPASLGRAYGVTLVLLGSLRDPDGPTGPASLAVHLEAVSCRGNRVEWVEECDAVPADVAGLRARLSRGVIAHFAVPFASEAGAGADPQPRTRAATEAYLAGLGWLADPDTPSARDSAVAAFDRALAADSTYGRALAGRARAERWLYLRDHDSTWIALAERDARRAAASAPSEIEGRLALAKVLQERGRAAEAVEQLRLVLTRNDRLADAHAALGAALRQSGDLAAARRSFLRAVELQPDSPSLWRSWGTFLLLGAADLPAAERAFLKAIELAPGENRGYELLAATYTMECRYDEALATYARVPKPEAFNIDARSNRATAFYFARRWTEALAEFREVVAAMPDDGTWRINLGDCYQHVGRRDEAVAQYDSACRLFERDLLVNPGSAALQARLAASLAKAGDLARSRALTREAFARLPADAEVLHDLAKALVLCGERERALAAIDTLVLARGFAPCLLRAEDEFGVLADEPRFRARVGPRR